MDSAMAWNIDCTTVHAILPEWCFLTDSGLVALEVEKGMSLPTLRAIHEEMPLAGWACVEPTSTGEQQLGRA